MDNIYYAKGNMQFTRQASISDTIGLGERPEIVLLIDPIAYTPEALCAWNHRHRIQVISPHKRTGAGHHTPARAIPMQDERLTWDFAAFDDFHANRPDITCGDGCDGAQRVVIDLRLPNIRAGHNSPDGAIPVLSQGLCGSSLPSILQVVAHRPHIMCGNGRY